MTTDTWDHRRGHAASVRELRRFAAQKQAAAARAGAAPARPAEDQYGPPTPEEVDTVMAATERLFAELTGEHQAAGDEDNREIVHLALSAVPKPERADYPQTLALFAAEHHERLVTLYTHWGPGSAPASRGRYMLAARPESLMLYERMETNPFLLRARWDKELEEVLLDDLEFAWGPRIRLSSR